MSVADAFSQSYYNSVMKGQEIVAAIQSPSLNNIFEDVVLPYMIPILFFAALSPGLLINIPPTSINHCKDVAPLPSGVEGTLGKCANGKYYPVSGGPAATQYDLICAAQQKCHQFGMSGTVTVWSALVHGIVYVLGFNVILYWASSFVARASARV